MFRAAKNKETNMASYIKAKDMTLREYYAGQALNGFLSYDQTIDTQTIEEYASDISKTAYVYADAMIKERAK